ncbi:MAG: hypothetical protein J5J00_10160 [Deltaproteobacteria bacterium]|nr:hypothetical protein [Deltaproteobacteria bacterium]
MRRILAVAVLLAVLPSCVLVPFIDSFKKAGVSEGDRQALLTERLKRFNDSLYWNSPIEALQYVDSERRSEIAPKLQRMVEGRRMVDGKVRNIEFGDSSFTAGVHIVMRSYRIPVYVVTEVEQKQTWKFSMASGWELWDLEVKEDKGKAF